MAPIVLRACLVPLVICVTSATASAEKRCGWIENPTPANVFLADRDGTWSLSIQGRPPPPGFDLVPDLSSHDFVATNGSYGYACGCLDATFDAERQALRLSAVKQLPLDVCRRDGALPKP